MLYPIELGVRGGHSSNFTWHVTNRTEYCTRNAVSSLDSTKNGRLQQGANITGWCYLADILLRPVILDFSGKVRSEILEPCGFPNERCLGSA